MEGFCDDYCGVTDFYWCYACGPGFGYDDPAEEPQLTLDLGGEELGTPVAIEMSIFGQALDTALVMNVQVGSAGYNIVADAAGSPRGGCSRDCFTRTYTGPTMDGGIPGFNWTSMAIDVVEFTGRCWCVVDFEFTVFYLSSDEVLCKSVPASLPPPPTSPPTLR